MAAVLPLAFNTFSQSAGIESPDTLLKMDSPSRIVITETHDGSVITVTGTDGENPFHSTIKTDYPDNSSVSSKQSVLNGSIFQLPGTESKRRGWKCYVDGITIGLTDASGQGGDGGLQWSKSIEAGWLSCLSAGYGWENTALTVGLGFDWRNYKITTSDRYLTPSPDKGIQWAPASSLPEGSRLLNSRLKVFSLQLPVLFRASIPRSRVKIKLGPVLNFNTYASLLTNYDDAGGNRVELFTKAIEPRRFTIDFFGSISLSNVVGVYVRYSPMKVMDATDGFNFRPLTIGVCIGI